MPVLLLFFTIYSTLIRISFHHKGCSPLRTAIPFWGQTIDNLSDWSLKWDCSPKRAEGLLIDISKVSWVGVNPAKERGFE